MVSSPSPSEPSGEPSGAAGTPPEPEPRPAKTSLATLTWGDIVRGHGPIALLMVLGAVVRGFRIEVPAGALMGDETYYVQAARVIAGFPVLPKHLHGFARSLIDPNREHPPLAKVIIAEFLRLMGNRELAWRLPSVVMSTLAIGLVYAIVLKLRGTRTQALMAAFILTFDNLCLVHGRIATLDIYFLFFILVGTLLYLSAYIELAAVAFAVATLCKTNAVLGFVAVVLYEVLLEWGGWRTPSWQALRRRAVAFAIYVAFFLLGLGALDGFFTEFTGPIAHLKFMGSFHSGLKSHGEPSGTHSIPPQWWLNRGTFNYYSTRTVVHGVVTRHMIVEAAMNNYFIFLAPLGLVYASLRAWKVRSPLATFAVASFLGNFAPLVAAWLVFSRTSYIYYMLPVIPSLACGLAVAAESVPSKVRWGFVVLMLYSFAYQYPVRVW